MKKGKKILTGIFGTAAAAALIGGAGFGIYKAESTILSVEDGAGNALLRRIPPHQQSVETLK